MTDEYLESLKRLHADLPRLDERLAIGVILELLIRDRQSENARLQEAAQRSVGG